MSKQERGVWVTRSQGGASVYVFSAEVPALRKAVELTRGYRAVFVPYGEDATTYEAPEGGSDG